jgi:hypothetical protein
VSDRKQTAALPSGDSGRRGRIRWGRGILLTLLVVALVVLHQDYWNWGEYKPLWFGFVPVGLWYQALYCVICSLLMWLLVLMVWPRHLETLEGPGTPDGKGNEGGHP